MNRIEKLFNLRLKVISLGIEVFSEVLQKCQVEVVHLDWRPPAGGDKKLIYVSAKGLLGADTEGTVDGTHPTDLGFLRMADAIEPGLRRALKSVP